jgi:Right handed beta helix region
MQKKDKTSWATVLVLTVPCLHGLANVGCATFSTGKSATPAPVLSISGRISPTAYGIGVTMTLSGETSATITTDSSGNYSFNDLSAGSYTLTPGKSGFSFSPASRQVTTSASITGTNFTVSSAAQQSGPIVISGENGRVIQGLRISSQSGDCLKITNSTQITIQNSEIGPCAGNGIEISGGSGIKVLDSYIHPETLSPRCCDHNDGIFASGGTQDLWVQGNVIAYGESNIEVQGSNRVTVVGNFLLNPRGPFPRGQNFQCWNKCSNVTLQNNYALSSLDRTQYLYPEATEDSINFGITTSFLARDNFISGGHSASGCGIMADSFSNSGQILNNLLVDTGQCGIGIVDGSHMVEQNKVYNRNPVAGSGNTAIYVAHYGQSPVCGPVTVTNNIADEVRLDGTHSGWWTAGNCGTIDIATDQFGESADALLGNLLAASSAPLIPPQPNNCVVTSPYSTQSSAIPCVP